MDTGLNTGVSQAPSAPSPETAMSSLRAAALLTLKSKRRKPPSIPGAPSARPAPTDSSVQLDYGQADSSSAVETATPAPPAPSVPADVSAEVVEEGQIREEGEISETEEPPMKAVRPKPMDVVPPAPQGPKRMDEMKTVPHLRTVPTSSDIPRSTSTGVRQYIIDADHVRPGLSINQAQYDKAKDIVLDLLGWGVGPEYLVDCGLSREIVYYVFSELNLRLPRNLDITGLLPYTVPDISKRSRSASGSFTKPLHNGTSTSAGSLSSIPQHSTAIESLAPPTVSSSKSTATPTTSASPTSPSPSTPNLHDIEQQRKQELLARKAVQASRKPKQVPATGSEVSATPSHPPVSVSVDRDVEMTPIVPRESVDDFLKSIEPAASSDEKMADDAPAPGDMQVDDSDSATTPKASDRDDGASESRPILGDSVASLSRRGTKRPVASDFVDFDHDLRGGYQNGAYANHVLRRKVGLGFASVSGMRRCVIDLSDSEDDVVPDYVSPVSEGRYSPALGGSRAVAVVTPATLTEKEKEIKRMKELIREREERGRMKKLASMANTGGAGPSSLPTISIPPAVERDDGDDSVAAEEMDSVASEPPVSASTSATPIDSDRESEPMAVEQVDDGPEQADRSISERTLDELVDGGGALPCVTTRDGYAAYDSPFECYPLLMSSSEVRNARRHAVAIAMKRVEPGQHVCRYEVPGGGICKDGGCLDVHLSRIV